MAISKRKLRFETLFNNYLRAHTQNPLVPQPGEDNLPRPHDRARIPRQAAAARRLQDRPAALRAHHPLRPAARFHLPGRPRAVEHRKVFFSKRWKHCE